MTSESRYELSGIGITLFGGIKGLITEGQALRKSLLAERPDAILISISEEHVEGLANFIKDPFEMILSDYEIIYGAHLSVYGEVMTPPPIYIESVKYSEETGIPLVGLDMNEKEFSTLYSEKVGTLSLMRHSIRKRRLVKKEFRDRTPEEFVKAWEERVNNIRALREVDEIRVDSMEAKMKDALSEREWKKVFVVVDYEFYDQFSKYITELVQHQD